MLCAIADDDRLNDVVAASRILAGTGALCPVYAHVGRPARLAPTPIGFGVGAGAAALAHAPGTAAEQVQETGEAIFDEVDLWDDPAVLATGDPVTELSRLALEHRAALLVAGTHGRGPLARALLGGVSRGLAREGPCPVLLVRAGGVPAPGGPVVCAVDLTTDHHAATATHAARLAAWTERPLVLVHVLRMEFAPVVGGPVLAPVPLAPDPGEHTAADEALVALASRLPLDPAGVERVVLDPAPVAARLDEFARSRRAGFLVVGSRGCGALRTAMEGSVSEDLLRRAARPLVVVPPAAGPGA